MKGLRTASTDRSEVRGFVDPVGMPWARAMVFSSPAFLFYFLPLALALWGLAVGVDAGWRRAMGRSTPSFLAQNAVLLVVSVAFYVYGAGVLVGIMAAAVLVSALSALAIEHTSFKKSALFVAVVGQLGLLAWFKYANFVVAQVEAISGQSIAGWKAVVLPIGISFFIFQSISYVVDVYRGTSRALRNPLDVALYVALFPQLIAGPIVRYQEVATQIGHRTVSAGDIQAGLTRFLYGLCKKVLIADSVGAVVDVAFAVTPGDQTAATATVGALAYVMQIYFDFSAYSDMAIGLGRVFGFTFPENFHRPYSASSITDFWRRWHMTLSNWFRDYLYIPLGGSRGGAGRTYLNLWIVFLASGLWHGANWTFVLWGALHGLFLTLERVFRVPVAGTGAWRRGLTFVLVTLCFLIFRADDVGHAGAMLKQLAMPTDWSLPYRVEDQLQHRSILALALGGLSLFLPRDVVFGKVVADDPSLLGTIARVALIPLSVVTLAQIASSNFSPFLYFQF